MTPSLPPGVNPSDELEVNWETGEDGTLVKVSLGDVSITVSCSADSASLVPWLVAALPSALEAAWEVIEFKLPEESK